MPEQTLKIIALGVTAILAVSIAMTSLAPLPPMPQAAGSDKLQHFIAYGTAVLPVALLYPRALSWVFPALLLEAGLIELIQPLVNRHGEWLDMAANLGGLVAGVGLGLVLRSNLYRLRRNRL